MRTIRYALLMWLLLSPPAIAGDDAAAPFFTRLAGTWQGTGTTSGMPSVQRLQWEPVLDAAFVRLTLENRMTTKEGQEWRFQAQAFYKVSPDGGITGTWFDSRGLTFPLAGSVDAAGVLTIAWGSDDTERGRSHYRIADGALEVTDEAQGKDGALAVFGRSTLKREP